MGAEMRTRLCPTHVMVVSGLLISSITSPSLRAQQPDAAAPQPADGGATGLEEIVVTATRKAESLSHVPLSVTALTQQNMDDANVRNLSDIQSMTPGLQFSPQAGAINAPSPTTPANPIASTNACSISSSLADANAAPASSRSNAPAC